MSGVTADGVYRHKPLSQIIAGAQAGERKAEPTTEAPQAEAGQNSELPPEYQGKTPEQLVEMVKASQAQIGRQANELGQLRGLVSDLAQVQRAPTPQAPEPEIELSRDDFDADPVGTIRKVVQPELEKVQAETSASRQNTDVALANQQLYADHPDLEQVVGSQEFQEFAGRTISRQMDLQAASNGEGLDQVNAARRLVENFKDFQSQKAPSGQEKPDPVAAAKAAANQGPAPAGRVSSDEVIYESDVIKMITEDPAKYRSPSFQATLKKAIKNGNFVSTG